MEKNQSFFNNGALRLPPGFRFHPTDEELVLQYLRRKALSFPLPAAIIPDLHLCNSNPWDIPGDGDQERYFFTKKETRYPSGRSGSNRVAGAGYWRSTGADKRVVSSGGKLVGMKKTLVFCRGKTSTDWVMHEYRLVCDQVEAVGEDWVLCRVFLKKKKKGDQAVRWQTRGNRRNSNGTIAVPVMYDFMKNENDDRCCSCSCSSSCSSVITELTFSGSEDREESSSLSSRVSPSSPSSSSSSSSDCHREP